MTTMPLSGDTVVYQNFLMKRSQMTRIFRRRFTILTANGKLYSFRKVDLSVPETFDLSQASLVWDIRGCSVERSPNKHTWILKPTGPNLKEEVHLRTCSALPSSSAHHWMKVMLAVARNNLRSLYIDPPVPILTVKYTLATNSVALYVESEGSLYPFTTIDNETCEYSTQLPVRDNSPGSCIIMRQFMSENGGETSFAQSDLIPRYRFHKAQTTLPWTSCKPQTISLFTEGGTVAQSGPCRFNTNESLRDYTMPILTRVPDAQDSLLDLPMFKFQIKRLIRLIERIGTFKNGLVDILEWKDTFTSWIWLVYLSIILLLFPGLVPSLICLHVAWFSLLNSHEFRQWWEPSVCRSLIGQVRRILGFPLMRGVPATHVNPAKTAPAISAPDVPSVSSPQLQQTTNRLKSAMKEAAVSAMQSVSKTLANSPRVNSADRLKSEIWENQRRVIGGNQFHASNLSIFDRSRWSDDTGTVALEAPSSRDWKIDIDLRKTDENGWMYSFRWNSGDYHPNFSSFDFVRRRKWNPNASPPGSLTSPPPAVNPPPFELAEAQFELNIEENTVGSSSPVVASLSGMITSGPEYGNIQEDYDEVNAELQPKKTAGFTNMLQEFKSTANTAQIEIGNICEEIERYLALLSWRDELVSTVATTVLILALVALLLIPINFILYAVLLSYFHVGYRRNKWRNVAVKSILRKHVEPLMLGGTPSSLGGLDAHKLCITLSKRTGITVTQKVLADMDSREELAMWLCAQTPAFSQVRKWMKRDWIENFIDHVPPDVCEEQQMFFPDTSTYQTTAPRQVSGSQTPPMVLGSLTPPDMARSEDADTNSAISETL